MKQISIKNVIGSKVNPEDGIIIRQMIEDSLTETIVLDFDNIDKISTAFLSNIFTELINEKGREYVKNHIDVKNISNMSNYKRVVEGTAF